MNVTLSRTGIGISREVPFRACIISRKHSELSKLCSQIPSHFREFLKTFPEVFVCTLHRCLHTLTVNARRLFTRFRNRFRSSNLERETKAKILKWWIAQRVVLTIVTIYKAIGPMFRPQNHLTITRCEKNSIDVVKRKLVLNWGKPKSCRKILEANEYALNL